MHEKWSKTMSKLPYLERAGVADLVPADRQPLQAIVGAEAGGDVARTLRPDVVAAEPEPQQRVVATKPVDEN